MSWWSDRDFRPSTTKKVEKILDIIAEIAKAEYERGKADAMKECGKAGRMQGEWEEESVFHNEDDTPIIAEWQSARCSLCHRYHTTPYMYYFNNYNFCPNCGADMRKRTDDE